MDDPLLVNGVNGGEHLLPGEANEVHVAARRLAPLAVAFLPIQDLLLLQDVVQVNLSKLHGKEDGLALQVDLAVVQLDDRRIAPEAFEEADLVGVAGDGLLVHTRKLDLLNGEDLAIARKRAIDLAAASPTDHSQLGVRGAVDGDYVVFRH